MTWCDKGKRFSTTLITGADGIKRLSLSCLAVKLDRIQKRNMII